MLQDAGFSLYAVTAEPGGCTLLKERLAVHIRNPLPFEVVSDPHHMLSSTFGKHVMYLTPLNAKEKFGGATDRMDYTVIQPAVFIATSDLVVTKWWSWRNLTQIDHSLDMVGRSGSAQEVGLPRCSGGAPACCKVPLVLVRPTAASLVAAATTGSELVFIQVANSRA